MNDKSNGDKDPKSAEPALPAPAPNDDAAKAAESASAAALDESAGTSAEAAKIAEEVPTAADPVAGPTRAAAKPQVPLRPANVTAIVVAVLSALVALLLMAHNGRVAIGIPLGLIAVSVCAFALLDAFHTFERHADAALRTSSAVDAGKLALPLARTLGSFVLFALSLAGAGAGYLHGARIVWAVLVPATFLAFVAGIFALGTALGVYENDPDGTPRPLLKRHGFWLVAIATLLYMPMMGMFSLWDPWETHYGEVAREIIARDDWVSLWWSQDGWFWSKPILNFWMQALAMGTLGTGAAPDHMMIGAAPGLASPEWVVRAPNVMLTILGMYLLYRGVARVFGRRAGLFGGIALATMPDWYFLAHQTMADMPCIAPMTAAMGLALLGIAAPDSQHMRQYPVRILGRVVHLSALHLVMVPIAICALPQAIYLISRNLELALHGAGPHGFRAHWDEFQSGSFGNCGLPGNEPCATKAPAAAARFLGNPLAHFFAGFEPVLQGVVWLAALLGLLFFNRKESRVARLYFIAAAFFCSLAMMGKGPLGIVIPAGTAIVTLVVTRRFKKLPQLEWFSFALVLAVVAAPWFVAMYVRHGAPFVDRLFFHDMYNRALGHVHDTNEGDDTSFRFYIWQIGYATFPFTGLLPLGLLQWIRRSEVVGESAAESATRPGSASSAQLAETSAAGEGDELEPQVTSAFGAFAFWRQSDRVEASEKATAHVFLAVWFVLVFALVSFMGTKFHHYIFPAIPPLAMLVGIALDDFLGDDVFARGKRLALDLALAGGSAVFTVYGVARFFPGSVFGDKPISGVLEPVHVGAGAASVAIGIAAFAWLVARTGFRANATALTTNEPLLVDAGAAKPSEHAYRGVVPPNAAATAAAQATAKSALAAVGAHGQLMTAAAVFAGAGLMLLVGRDLAVTENTGDQPGAIRLLQLFTYNYRRSWPTESLHFGAILTALVFIGLALYLLLTVARLRKAAMLTFFAFSLLAALWGIDVYMVKLAPHWGQRELFEAYYKLRTGPEEQVVAYQMNWKGENFYSSNRIPAFVSSGAVFTTWIKAQREKGIKVIYFVTEHSRVGGLRSEVAGKELKEITDKRINNKFLLVRVEL